LPSPAADAAQYVGSRYTYGGIPAQGTGHWDCSSFVNWVVGHDCGMAIPGYAAGKYTGSTHGPVVIDWFTWSGATTVSDPAADDIVVWPGLGTGGHIGIVVDSSHMISALNTSLGTVQTPIQGYGPGGVAAVYRRLKGGTSGSTTALPAGCLIAMLEAVYGLGIRYYRCHHRNGGNG
jgi:cell wall-associated NlpC family hydrolase